MPENRLTREQSPYLLQHAHNPVDWFPWGPEAFEKARAENKPVFLSIGYSTCHWCHVMERESFENEEIAALLNHHFVSIKVDREERPDVDRIYMTYVQATTGSGGWPMSVWLTPAGKPFVGGTYFPPENRYGRPGFPVILERIAAAWEREREKIEASSEQVLQELRRQAEVAPEDASRPDLKTLDTAFQGWRRGFDSRLGGFGGAPKFPRPSVLSFLFRYHARTKNEEALEMALVTLRAMAKGGMHDQLGGGFHRYSVDEYWFVPHFEKMLYDQAQLAIAYLEAFQITADEQYARAARKTLDYVLRDMTDPAGGFYSAEDADSIIDAAHPDEKGEGAFYIWPAAEIEALLEGPVAQWFQFRYGAEEQGNVRNDPHGEFAGHNILFEAHTVEETAQHFEQPVETVQAALANAERKLLGAREHRVRPHLDDKVLTAWNGLMISALAKAAAILHEPRYWEAARRATDFVVTTMIDAHTGVLLRRYRKGGAAIPGFADDYAFFVQALLDVYETGFQLRDLQRALTLTGKMRELFEDPQGGFYSTAEGDRMLVMRIKDDYDGAEPSANSIAALNLLRLAQMTGNDELRQSAYRTLAAFAGRLTAQAAAVPQMLTALDWGLTPPKQIILAGERDSPEMYELLRMLYGHFLPNQVVLLADEASRSQLGVYQPVIAGMTPVEGRSAAYVCENFVCQLPVSDPAQFAELLQ